MTAVFIKALDGVRWCRLTTVGIANHGTACLLGHIPTDDPILLSADPPIEERCNACSRDLEAKKARVPTVDLMPRTWTGEVADLEVDAGLAIPREITVEW
jgi:hypothetical protein